MRAIRSIFIFIQAILLASHFSWAQTPAVYLAVYPPALMSANTQTLSGLTYGNGQYQATASSFYSLSNGPSPPWQSFDFVATGVHGWTQENPNYNFYASGDYTGSFSTTSGGVSYAGEWLQISLPEQINLTQYEIYASYDFSRGPEKFWIFGSNNGSVWDVIDTRIGVTGYTAAGKLFTVQVGQKYSFFRLGIKKNVGNTWLSIAEWRLYGSDYVSGNNYCSRTGVPGCLCNIGYEPSGPSCAACPAGKFKVTIGNTTCSSCAANQYSPSITVSTCIPCGPNANSVAGSSSCSCNAGHQPNGTACVACPSNTYKTTSGNTTCLACAANQWSNIAAKACNSNPLVNLPAIGGASNIPPSGGATLNYKSNGEFWLFGGWITDVVSSLWKFNRDTGRYTFIDGSNSSGTLARIANKPSPRIMHASWVDETGNLFIFGGSGYGESGSTSGTLGDTWVYNISSGWRYISGSKTVNQNTAGSLENRYVAGHWKGADDNCFYIFGGAGTGWYNSVWKFDPSSVSPRWTFVIGSNSTNAAAVIAGQPTPRGQVSCDVAPVSGAYCLGGQSYLSVILAEFWRFDSTPTPQWTLIHSNTASVSGPSARCETQLVTNRVAGKVYVLFGWTGSTSFSDVFSFSISTQQWSTIVSSSSTTHQRFGADLDDRNTIYYWGSSGGDTKLWMITCLAGQYFNAGVCTECPPGFFSSTHNSTLCTPCSANTFSATPGTITCAACPTNMGSVMGSSSCVCNAGYQLSGATCSACTAGTYKSTLGNGTCIPCGPNANSVAGASACTCNVGHQPNGTSCDACPSSSFKASSGNTTCSACAANQWSSIGATACSNDPLITLSANGATTNVPSTRQGHNFNYDRNGGFFTFGGYNGAYTSSLWRYNRNSNTFSFLDGSNSTNSAGILPNKPTPRDCYASWVDSMGNFWIFGGYGYSTDGASTGVLGDTWVYNISGSGWRLVTGSRIPNDAPAGSLGARFGVGHWFDASENSFYLSGGYLTANYASTWKLNLSVADPIWTFVFGTNSTNTPTSNHPTPRYGGSCDAAPTSGGYCYGGINHLSVYLADLWRFNPSSTPQWSQIQSDSSTAGGPVGRMYFKLLVNRAGGRIFVLYGKNPSFLADVWSFSIATQQWTSVVSAAAAPRGYYGGDMDDRNMIYYFGGQSTSNAMRNDIVVITCVSGQYFNAGICTECPANSFSTTPNATSCSCTAGHQPNGTACEACPSNTYKGTSGNTPCLACAANQWSSIAATSCNNDSLITLSTDGVASNTPSRRDGHSFNYGNNGSFWVFGGRTNTSNSGYLNSLWRYNRDARTFSFIDGSNNTGGDAIIATKPSPRADHASWVDNSGNIWVTGGWGWNETRQSTSIPILDRLSTAGRSAARGAYALYRLSASYIGPIIKLRRSTDSVQQDFYANAAGTFGTGLDGTGTSVSTWLGAATAFVVTWYDQSGSGNHATQSTVAAQPTFNVNSLLIDFLSDSARFLTMPSGTVPVEAANAKYSFVFKHGTASGTQSGGILGAGAVTNSRANCIRFGAVNNVAYWNYWWYNDYSMGSTSNIVAGNIVSVKYDGTNRQGYINGVAYAATASTNGNTIAGPQYIGKTVADEYMNGQLYFVYIFGDALSDADRIVCESTGPVTTAFSTAITLNEPSGVLNSNVTVSGLGLLSDTWVYNVSGSGWRLVTGSKIADQVTAGSLEPRWSVAHWKDAGDDKFYLFGGYGRTASTWGRLQSVWRLDPSVATPQWQFVSGSNATDASGVVVNEPVPRFGASCDAAPTTGAFCFGGYSHLDANLADFWQFNPLNAQPWMSIHANTTAVGGPSARRAHIVLVNRVASKVYVLFGQNSAALSDVWSYSIATQQWSAVVSSSTTSRYYLGADMDERNMIYYFGGINTNRLNDLSFMPCLPGEINNAGVCTPCPIGTFASSVNSTSCAPCPSNTFSTTVGASSISSCIVCPLNMVPTSGSSASSCACDIGYTNNGTDCVACSAGTYKSSTGNGTCTDCVANSYSVALAATSNNTCISCGANSFSNAGSSTCSCLAGYFLDGGACVSCAPGTFKGIIGNSPCTNCSTNFWSSSGATACTSCGTNAVSIAGSSSCSCDAGYTMSDDACVQCSAGSYKTSSGNGTCTQCVANSYSIVLGATSNNTCISCGANAFSAIGSSSCACNAGYYSNGGGCVACVAGTFKSAADNSTCTNCAENSWSSSGATACTSCGTNAVSIAGSSSCSCDAGYTMSDDACVQCSAGTYKTSSGNGTCTQCVANSYSTALGATSNNTCISCGPNAFSAVGSSSCSCNAGYYSNGGACVACSPGTFKSASDNSTCTNCSANFWSSAGAVSCNACGTGAISAAGSANCICNAGYYGTGSSCTQCAAGTYKTTTGNGTCTQCLANSYSEANAATSISTCVACGSNMISAAGSSACSCVAGYYPNNGACVACPDGTYKSSSGNATCSSCPSNQGLGTGATTCGNCGSGAVGISGSTSCVCDVGYTQSGINCVQCTAGSYKSAVGNGTCTQCSANSYSTVVGATSSSTCISCGLNSASIAGSSACSCNAGYESQGTSCVACSEGKFKAAAGNGTVCINCGANQYSLQGASTCLQCGANAISTPGSPSCNCNAGYEPLNGACVACTAGKAKSLSGNTSCTTCLANEYSKQGASVCSACGTGLISDAGSSSCTCAAGYEVNGNTCSPCPTGKFKSSSGNVSCTSCLANEYSKQGATSCIACGSGLTSTAGSSSCICAAGYEISGSTCSPCPAGKFKATSGNLTCANCITDYYSLQGASSCLQCGAHATSTSGSPSCNCVPGYYQVNDACSPCTGNTFKSSIGNGSCISCGTSAISSGTTCTCPLTHYGDPLTGCSLCPDGKNRTAITTATTASTDCVTSIAKCLAGYYGNPSTTCTKCLVNTYRSGDSTSITTLSDCVVCPVHAGTNGVDGATSVSQCVCNAGYYRDATTSTCLACAIDTFKSTTGNGECTACATGTATNNATASTSCSVCAAGYKGNAPNCQACGVGFTKPNPGNGGCDAVPAPEPTPNPPKNSEANPLASLMGVSNEIFFIIIGSVAVALIAAASATVIIRKRIKKRKLLAKKTAQQKLTGITTRQQPGMLTTGNTFVPLMTARTNTNTVMPYGAPPRTMGTMMSMPRTGAVYPMGMQPMTAATYGTQGTAGRLMNGATMSTVGPR